MLAAGGNHLGGVLQAGISDLGAAQHACNLVGAGAVVEDTDAGLGASVFLSLFHSEVLISEGCDLGQMRNAQDLLGATERLEFVPNGFGCAASDAYVDFIEDEGAGSRFLSGLEEFSSTATLRASITRLSSPPEAISTRSLSGSPGLVAIRYSTVSQPEEVQSEFPLVAEAPESCLDLIGTIALKSCPFKAGLLSARLKSCPDSFSCFPDSVFSCFSGVSSHGAKEPLHWKRQRPRSEPSWQVS